MSYLRVAGGTARSLCCFLFSIAVFLLWTSLAAGAGFILIQLPDVWATHSNDENSRYAVMSVTAYALIVGVLFLIFTAGAIERISDSVIAARKTVKHVREMRAVRLIHHGGFSAETPHPLQSTL